MFEARAEISIDASPVDVFQVLKDFKNYSKWNPWIAIDGKPTEQEYIRVKPRRFFWIFRNFKIARMRSPEQIIWHGKNWFSFLMHTDRQNIIYQTTNGTSIYMVDFYFLGPLARIASFLYRNKIHKELNNEAIALKRYCEKNFKPSVVL